MDPKEFDIEFVRGDTCPVEFDITNQDGEGLDDLENANIYFTVKNSFSDINYLFQKTYSAGQISKEGNVYSLIILPTDTENLDYGRYVYDICVVCQDFKATLVRGTLTLTNEVTFASNE